MKSPPDPRYRHRFPAEILLAERGIVVSYETV
jgi:hypothetical protein